MNDDAITVVALTVEMMWLVWHSTIKKKKEEEEEKGSFIEPYSR